MVDKRAGNALLNVTITGSNRQSFWRLVRRAGRTHRCREGRQLRKCTEFTVPVSLLKRHQHGVDEITVGQLKSLPILVLVRLVFATASERDGSGTAKSAPIRQDGKQDLAVIERAGAKNMAHCHAGPVQHLFAQQCTPILHFLCNRQ